MQHQDAQLLERWQQHRDADAFTELVQRYSGLVYACCWRVLGNGAEAEEAAQECFITLMHSRDRVRSSLGAWLHTVAVRRCVDHVRSSERRRRRETAFAGELPHSAQQRDHATTELLEHVDEAIAALPAPLRVAVVARFLEQRRHVDIAQQLGVAESTVRYRLSQGVEQIRERLKRKGIAVSAAALGGALEQTAQAAPASFAQNAAKLAVSGIAPGAGTAAAAGSSIAFGAKLLSGIAAALIIAWAWSYTRPDHAEPAANGPAATASAAASLAAPEAAPASASAAAAAEQAPEPSAEGGVVASGAPGDAAPYSIRGRVYDEATGEGIANVTLQVVHAGSYVATSEPTGPSGEYMIEPLGDGAYDVTLRDVPGYPDPARSRRVSVTVVDGEPADGVDFALKKGIAVSGEVRTAQGIPANGAWAGVTGPSIYNPLTDETGEDGRFTIYIPDPTRGLMVQARTDSAESLPESGLTVPDSGLDGLLLVLDQPRTASISGQITDSAGNPVADARVIPYKKSPSVYLAGEQTYPDVEGRFELTGLGPGEYALIVTEKNASGFSTAEERARVRLGPGERVDGVNILYGDEGGFAIAGHVTDSEGSPIARAELTIFDTRMVRARSGRDGSFMFTGLEDRTYGIRIEHQDYAWADATLPAGTIDAQIVLERHATVSGRVLNAATGQPLTSFTLGMLHGSGGELTEMLYGAGKPMESPGGTFSFDQVRMPHIGLVAWAPGFAITTQAVTVPPGGETFVELKLTPVDPFEGEVVNRAGEPVDQAFVYFVGDVSVDRVNRAAAARTDSDGRFTLVSPPEDAAWIAAHKPGYGVGMMRLPRERRIVLPEPARFEGRLHAEGVSMGDVLVYMRYEDAPHLPHGTARPDSNGVFEIADLSPGLMMVSATVGSEIRYTIEQAVQIVEGRIYKGDFVFQYGTSTVEGAVTRDGAPVRPQYVELEQRGAVQTRRLTTRLDEQGRYRFEGVWPGSLVLKYTQYDSGAPQAYELMFDVPQGAVVEQDMAL